ncbi:MAG: LarC family nickel insertion protein, partial [Lachnospiraceae bacterium]|nr:LarC family nickel insertion protein [Lachnospiraceae bacterium]
AAIRTKEPMPARYIIEEIGLGAGKRECETSGFLRAMLIRVISEENHKKEEDRICKLETDVDDCTGEMLGHVMNLLFEAGAKDVHYTPIYMKKNRPAVEITVICEPDKTDVMESILFRETTTIGIRRCLMERTVLERSFEECDTPWGKIRMKVCRIPGGGELRRYPEYEDARLAAEKARIPLVDIYRFLGE